MRGTKLTFVGDGWGGTPERRIEERRFGLVDGETEGDSEGIVDGEGRDAKTSLNEAARRAREEGKRAL